MKYRKKFIMSIIVLMIAMLGTSLAHAESGALTDAEKHAEKCIEEIYFMLKNPQSLQVISIEWIKDSWNSDGDVEGDIYYVDFTAQNSMGGMTRDYWVFSLSNHWSYRDDVKDKDLETEVPVGAIRGFMYQQQGKGIALDVQKIMTHFWSKYRY